MGNAKGCNAKEPTNRINYTKLVARGALTGDATKLILYCVISNTFKHFFLFPKLEHSVFS